MLARDYPHIRCRAAWMIRRLSSLHGERGLGSVRGPTLPPKAHIALYQACAVEGDFTKGRAIMSAMLPLMRVLEQGGKFVQCIKYGLTLRGIDAGTVRKPLQPLNKDDKRQLAEVIRTMNTTIASITGEPL